MPDDLQRSLGGESVRRQRATLTTTAGTERIIEFSTTPIRDSEGVTQFAMLVVQDLTVAERTRAYWQAVGTAAEGLTSELNVEKVLQSAIDMIVASFGDRVVLGIWHLDDAREQLQLRIYRGISEATADFLRSLPVDASSFICDAVQRREPQFIEDAQATPPLGEIDRRIVANEGLSSWIASPLLTGVNMIGAMGYGLRAPQRFYQEDLEAVRTIGRLFAVAIEHAELYEESQRQRDALEQTAAERQLFVSTLAHDLRSPLAGLKGAAQLLARSSETESAERNEYLAGISEHVDRLARLVDDLSASYLTDEPNYAVRRQRVDLIAPLERVRRVVDGPASAQRFRIDGPDEVLGEWDPARLDQVFTDLLSNAMKFSPARSEVLLRIDTRPDEVLVIVVDEGVGLEPEEIPKLFQPFTRVGATEATEGSGLGLYTARRVVEAHGGRIWAESAGPGTGTTMTVALPYGWSPS